MAYIAGDGSIRRQRHAIERDTRSRLNGLLCAVALAVAVAVGTVPEIAALKELRVKADGLWFAPAVSDYHHFGAFAAARAPVRRRRGVLHVGAFGAWVAVDADAAPVAALARDDARLLLGAIGLIFAIQLARPRPWLRRHCAASLENVRAGRPWCVVLGALAHGDVVHFATNGVSLARSAPRLVARLDGDRRAFWLFVCGAAAAASLTSLVARRAARYETRGASGVVFAMLAFEARRAPDAVASFFGIVDLPASSALAASLAVDALLRGGAVDAWAHAGGAAFGALAERVL